MPSVFNTAIQSIKVALQSLSHLNKSNLCHTNERETPHRPPFFITLCTHTNSRDDSELSQPLEHMSKNYANTIKIYRLMLARWYQLWIT